MGLISFLAFTLLVAGFAWWKTRGTDEKSADGYYLGGRTLGAITIAGSLLLTNLSAEQIVGLNGQAFSEGILVMAWETLAAIAIVIAAVFLLPKYMHKGITTIPEFVEERFDSWTRSILSILFLLAFGVVLLPTILYSGSLAFSTMFDLPSMLGLEEGSVILLCVWTIGIIGIIYAIFGGLKAVAVSDLVNAIGLLIGGLLIPYFGLKLIGDGSMAAGLNELWVENQDKFELTGNAASSIPATGLILTGMMVAQVYYWGTNQSILQRVFGAKSLKEGQKGMMIAAFVKFIIPVVVVLPGIIAWHIFDGNLESADKAYPQLVKEVLPPAFVGFFAAVLFGAVLSSFNSLLNSSATLFGFDLYIKFFNKEASEEKAVKSGKIFGLGLATVSMIIAPFIANAPDGLFDYIQQALGSLSVPILAVVLVGILTKKVPALGAKVVLISGVVMYIFTVFIRPGNWENALSNAKANGITDKLELAQIKIDTFPYHFLETMAWLFFINIIIMLVIGLIKPKTDTYVPKQTEAIDTTPWKYAGIVGIIIVLLVLSTYLIF